MVSRLRVTRISDNSGSVRNWVSRNRSSKYSSVVLVPKSLSAISWSVRSATRFKSSTLAKAKRITPPAKRLLPPDSSSDAASSMTTFAPCSRAASAAHSAALPFPTTITSCTAAAEVARQLTHVGQCFDALDRGINRVDGSRIQNARRARLELGVQTIGCQRVGGRAPERLLHLGSEHSAVAQRNPDLGAE